MLNTIRIYHDLKESMNDVAAEKISSYLGQMYTELREMATKEDFHELKAIVGELADAQNRTGQRMEQLAEAQNRTGQRMEQLAEAQNRTEQRVEQLAEAQNRTETELYALKDVVGDLAKAQQRTEIAIQDLKSVVADLAAAQQRTDQKLDRLSHQVGGLSDNIGGDIEDISYSMVPMILRDTFGWRIGRMERVWQTWGKEPEEVNIFAHATDPKTPETGIWIVGEAKHNLTLKELNKFIRQYERAKQHLRGPIYPICFCYRARPEVEDRAKEAGVHLLFSYGKLT